METTKSRVRSDFKYARELMRQADEAMRSYSPEPGQDDSQYEDMRAIAMELIAAVGTFEAWVEEARDAAEAAEEEAEEEINPLAVIMPPGAFNQQEWNAYTN